MKTKMDRLIHIVQMKTADAADDLYNVCDNIQHIQTLRIPNTQKTTCCGCFFYEPPGRHERLYQNRYELPLGL